MKEYLFASDFDQTLSFNDSGFVLSELLGIPAQEFERKAQGMARLNLVQQGAELSYLLLHDPQQNQITTPTTPNNQICRGGHREAVLSLVLAPFSAVCTNRGGS